MKVELRKPLLSDAKRYFEILNHPEFYYFSAKPVTIKAEQDFLRNILKHWEDGIEHSFVVLANGKLVGGAGFRISKERNREHICNIGYFIDRKYWSKGIATRAVGLLEDYIRANFDIVRAEIVMIKENVGSQKVAIKAGYKKEGLMKKYLSNSGKYYDSYLYAKILN